MPSCRACRDLQLVVEREIDAGRLRAVAQRRVEEKEAFAAIAAHTVRRRREETAAGPAFASALCPIALTTGHTSLRVTSATAPANQRTILIEDVIAPVFARKRRIGPRHGKGSSKPSPLAGRGSIAHRAIGGEGFSKAARESTSERLQDSTTHRCSRNAEPEIHSRQTSRRAQHHWRNPHAARRPPR
jgi:hypothetical protein